MMNQAATILFVTTAAASLSSWHTAAASSPSSHDSQFYSSEYGMQNPNIHNGLYFAEAANVLDNLDEFEALYVTHHNCA